MRKLSAVEPDGYETTLESSLFHFQDLKATYDFRR